jgi:predicted transcriptional regulator
VTLNIFAQSNVIYQVSEWNSKTVKYENSNEFSYDNDDVKVNYEFWNDSKGITFSVYNKSDNPITIDWTKSHFILWNYSNDFFKGSETTFSSSNLQRSTYYNITKTSQSSSSTVVKDKMESHIPPKSMVREEFYITNTLYFDCNNYFKKLKKDEVTKFEFTELNSIYKLRNYLTYFVSENKIKTIDNDFFITQILNMNSETFEGEEIKKEYCNEFGVKTTKVEYAFPYYKSNRQFQKLILPSSTGCF